MSNLLFVIIGVFYEEMQYIFIRKYSIFTGFSDLKVTGYDIFPLLFPFLIRFPLFLAYKIPDLMSYSVTLRSENPMKMVHFHACKDILHLSSLYVCMAIKHIIVLFVETPRKFITAKLSDDLH